jgi:hypothetical protein
MNTRKAHCFFAISIGILALVLAAGVPAGPASAEMGELETFIRARIEIGESMMAYMRNLRSDPDSDAESGRPSMEKMRQMEDEINAMVEEILNGYDLTIETYDQRSPEVFSDQAVLDAFLEAHPDLKERYEALPLHRARERRGSPGGPPPSSP